MMELKCYLLLLEWVEEQEPTESETKAELLATNLFFYSLPSDPVETL